MGQHDDVGPSSAIAAVVFAEDQIVQRITRLLLALRLCEGIALHTYQDHAGLVLVEAGECSSIQHQHRPVLGVDHLALGIDVHRRGIDRLALVVRQLGTVRGDQVASRILWHHKSLRRRSGEKLLVIKILVDGVVDAPQVAAHNDEGKGDKGSDERRDDPGESSAASPFGGGDRHVRQDRG